MPFFQHLLFSYTLCHSSVGEPLPREGAPSVSREVGKNPCKALAWLLPNLPNPLHTKWEQCPPRGMLAGRTTKALVCSEWPTWSHSALLDVGLGKAGGEELGAEERERQCQRDGEWGQQEKGRDRRVRKWKGRWSVRGDGTEWWRWVQQIVGRMGRHQRPP